MDATQLAKKSLVRKGLILAGSIAGLIVAGALFGVSAPDRSDSSESTDQEADKND